MSADAPTPPFEAAKAAFLQGLQHHHAGRFAEAEAAYRESLRLLPGRPSTLTNLAAVIVLRQPAEALGLLDQALAAEPGNADAWFQRGEALAVLQRLPEALASIERVLALQPDAGPAWSRRGGLLKDLGRSAEAVPALRRAVELGADVEMNRYLLASLEGGVAPPAAPSDYVAALFDSYAETFDEQLTDKLQYRTPQLLVQGLGGQRFDSALDLGCGTGLCGRLLRPCAGALHGVDLSAGMLDQARRLGVYDRLEQGDVVQHLAATPEHTHDLVIAADVFVYLGDLAAVFAQSRRVLREGGVFAFSVEAADDAVDFALRPSSRYAQSERYVRQLAAQHGFGITALQRETIRLDQRLPIEGLLVWLTRPRAH